MDELKRGELYILNQDSWLYPHFGDEALSSAFHVKAETIFMFLGLHQEKRHYIEILVGDKRGWVFYSSLNGKQVREI